VIGSLAPAAPRDEVRATAERVFDRPEFARSQSWLDRVGEWLADLFPDRSGGGGTFAAAGDLLLYLLAAVVVVLAVWLVVRAVRGGRPQRARHASSTSVSIEAVPGSRVVDWGAEAAAAEARGEWGLALVHRYRELVAELMVIGVLVDESGRTTGELRIDLLERRPAGAPAFDELSSAFERTWYGHRPVERADLEAARRRADEVRSRCGVAVEAA
jgi:hypothetical protein